MSAWRNRTDAKEAVKALPLTMLGQAKVCPRLTATQDVSTGNGESRQQSNGQGASPFVKRMLDVNSVQVQTLPRSLSEAPNSV